MDNKEPILNIAAPKYNAASRADDGTFTITDRQLLKPKFNFTDKGITLCDNTLYISGSLYSRSAAGNRGVINMIKHSIAELSKNKQPLFNVVIDCPDRKIPNQSAPIISMLATFKETGTLRTHVSGMASGWTAVIAAMGTEGFRTMDKDASIIITEDYSIALSNIECSGAKYKFCLNKDNPIKAAINACAALFPLTADECMHFTLVDRIINTK